MFGARYVGIGWLKHEFGKFSLEDAKKYVSAMNNFAATCKQHGLTFFYHFHGYEFVNVGGHDLFEYFMDNLTDDVVVELDLMWAEYGGADPVRILEKYGPRVKLLHMKDLRWGIGPIHRGMAPDATSVAMGNGQIDFPAVLRLAMKHGVELYIIEDEAEEAIEQIPVSLEYIERMRK
jgi:sugar phosphate isomerase/epimerase